MACNTNCIPSGKSSYTQILLAELKDLRESQRFVDITLICEDVLFPAHKLILSAASIYFKAMFGGNFPESTQTHVRLNEISAKWLRYIMDYIYSGTIDLTLDNVQGVLETSSFLQVECLLKECVKFMIDNMNPNNVLGFKSFAQFQNNVELLNAAQEFICERFQEVSCSEEFVHMSSSQIMAILSKDQLYMHSDDLVLAGLMRWAEHKPEKRMSHLGGFLSYLHPACVTAEVVRGLSIFESPTASEDVKSWLDEVMHSEKNMEWRIFILDKMGQKPSLMRFDSSFECTTHLKPLPAPAFGISFTYNKNILYVQGGKDNRSRKESFFYNIYRDQWHTLTPLLEERSHHRSLVWRDYLYALGGNTLRGTTDSVECLNLVTCRAISQGCMRRPRGSMGAVIYMSRMYVMGGENNNRSLYSMESYDPREGQWQDLPPMHDVNSYCSSAVIGENIYCSEGIGNCMERFDCRANRWVIVNFWEEREFYEIFAVDNILYSIYGKGIAKYDVENVRWLSVHEFPQQREWDTALGMRMLNYSF